MDDFEMMTRRLCRDLMVLLMQRRGYGLSEAADTLYNSDTYMIICDKQSGFYFQSAGYVYDFLNMEITTGKVMPE